MKANELRIGNLVFDDDSDNIMIISKTESAEYTKWNSGDEFNMVAVRQNTNTDYEGKFRPIELTEEWLIKFGFKNNSSFYRITVYDHFELCLYIFNIGNKYCRACYKSKSINIDIKYVHQLQNLYFYLTGEELKIN